MYTKGELRASHPLNGKTTIVDGDRFVANIHWGTLIFEQEQRELAYKFAASPDMYEALKLYQSHQKGTSGHYCGECAEAINKALSKAERGL